MTATLPPIEYHNIPLTWQENGATQHGIWRHHSASKPPRAIHIAPNQLNATTALKHWHAQQALIWRGDYHQAVQLLNAVKRRLPQRPHTDFHTHRMQQAQRSRLLNLLWVEIDAGLQLHLPRAPQSLQVALSDVFAPNDQPFFLSLNLLLGFIGARQWHEKGVFLPELGERIHVPFGVFSPIRGEYLSLVARQRLPEACDTAIDIGTGSGVLAVLLAQRGIAHIIATDNNPRATATARANFARLGLSHRIESVEIDLFPAHRRTDLIVCNPPWLPAKPTSAIETALYDPDSAMLRAVLERAADHLNPHGQLWLILSDLAEHLHLRPRHALIQLIENTGWRIVQIQSTRPNHPKSQSTDDPLSLARQQETVYLYVLQPSHEPYQTNSSTNRPSGSLFTHL